MTSLIKKLVKIIKIRIQIPLDFPESKIIENIYDWIIYHHTYHVTQNLHSIKFKTETP